MTMNVVFAQSVFESFLEAMLENGTDTIDVEIGLRNGIAGFQISLASLGGVPIGLLGDDDQPAAARVHPANSAPAQPFHVPDELVERIAKVCNEARCHSPRAVGNLELAQCISREVSSYFDAHPTV